MLAEIIKIFLIPFFGTVLGSACVFFISKGRNLALEKSMSGFAAGVMIASSVWSLIIPAIELSGEGVIPPFLPAAIGMWVGVIFFFCLDKVLDRLKLSQKNASSGYSTLTLLAIIIHNLPEGMALGVMCVAWLSNAPIISISAIITLAVGIGIQNFPEGAIISVPLYATGKSKSYSFFVGVLSAVTETLGSLLMIAMADIVVPILPYLMCFAAGAMIFVVINELCPEISEGKFSDLATLMFCAGFSVMMILDVALG